MSVPLSRPKKTTITTSRRTLADEAKYLARQRRAKQKTRASALGGRDEEEDASAAAAVLMHSARVWGPTIYMEAWRMTQSDVIAVTTSIPAAHTHRRRHGGVDSTRARDGTQLSFRQAVSRPPLESERDYHARLDARLHAQLHLEREIFLANLNGRRTRRMALENPAASAIQRCVRGYLLRKWLKTAKKSLIRRAMMKKSYKAVSRQIKLKMQLEENARRAKNRKGEACVVMQAAWRRVLGLKVAHKELITQRIELLSSAASAIQCLVRWRMSRRTAAKRRMRSWQARRLAAARVLQAAQLRWWSSRCATRRVVLIDALAAGVIQQFARHFLAGKATKGRAWRIEEEEKNSAALRLQPIYRGRLARFTVRRMRAAEKVELRHAAALAVERCWRGRLGRARAEFLDRHFRFEVKLIAALHISRVARGHLGRVYAIVEKDIQEEDLFVQCRKGNVEVVNDLFVGFSTDVEYTVESKDPKGNTLLAVAARWGHKAIVRKCLKWEIDPNVANDAGETPVMLCVRQCRVDTPELVDTAEYLISKPQVELVHFGRTLLHDAAARNLSKICKCLITRGVSADVADEDGETPLHSAVRQRRGRGRGRGRGREISWSWSAAPPPLRSALVVHLARLVCSSIETTPPPSLLLVAFLSFPSLLHTSNRRLPGRTRRLVRLWIGCMTRMQSTPSASPMASPLSTSQRRKGTKRCLSSSADKVELTYTSKTTTACKRGRWRKRKTTRHACRSFSLRSEEREMEGAIEKRVCGNKCG